MPNNHWEVVMIRTFRGRTLKTVLALTLLVGGAAAVAATEEAEAAVLHNVSIKLDGANIKLNEPVQVSNGSMFMPVADIASMLGAKTTWDSDNEAVTVHTDHGDKIVLSNGVPVVYLNEERYVLDAAPYIAEGRVYAPLRNVAELLHSTVNWDANTQIAELETIETAVATEQLGLTEAEPFTKADYMLLAKLTQVESGYESYEGQLAVANVILNRVKDSRFPDSIKEVIYSGKQFPPAHNGLLDKSVPNARVLRAAKDALNGKNNVKDAVYFYNPKVSTGSFWSSLEDIATFGSHRFAK